MSDRLILAPDNEDMEDFQDYTEDEEETGGLLPPPVTEAVVVTEAIVHDAMGGLVAPIQNEE